MKDFFLFLVAFFLLLAVAYSVVRVGSIAYYRTRAEYDRFVKRVKPLNGERDAQK